MGKNPIQATALRKYNQSHNPRMHEHVNKMLENAMLDHVISSQQNPTQKIYQKHKKPKIFPKPKT